MKLNVGGAVGITVRNARPAELAALHRQLGSLNQPLGDRPADIEIDYVDPPGTEALRLIGADAAARAEDFYLWDPGDAPTWLEVGRELPFRLRAPHGTARIPILVQLVSAAATRKGYLPLHASAFRWRGRGVLVAGWSKGGKSEALLSFMERGASYVGDEWMFMSPDEPVVSGIPEPIRVWDWHFDELPELRRRVEAIDKVRLAALRGLARGFGIAADRSEIARKLAELVNGQRYVRLDPAHLFGSRRCLRRSRVDAVFLMESADSPGVEVTSADPATTAGRIAVSTTYEHLRLLEAELKRCYARPDRGTPWWDALEPIGEALSKRLSGFPVLQVTHPYPVSTSELFWAMAPAIEEAGT